MEELRFKSNSQRPTAIYKFLSIDLGIVDKMFNYIFKKKYLNFIKAKIYK